MQKVKPVLPLLVIGNILCMMDVSIVTIIMPKLQSTFNVSLDDLSWVINIYTIIFAAFIIPFGRLADKMGRNKLIFIGLCIFGLGSLGSGTAVNLNVLLIFRAIQSLGAAIIIPTSMVVALELTDSKNRNKIIGILAGSQGLAVALGPCVGGFISQYWDWRWVFFINIPFIILILLRLPFVLSIKNEQTIQTKNDWFGTFLSIIALFTLSLGLIKGNSWGWHSQIILLLFLIALLASILFLFWERHIAHPMIDLSLFKSRNFNAACFALILCNFFLGGMVVLMPTFLTKIHNLSEIHAALLITPYSVSVMIAVVLSALLAKRINHKFMIGIGFLLISGSYYILSQLPDKDYVLQLIISDILLGIGFGMVAAIANIMVIADFHGVQLTSSQSVANVLRQVGLVLSIAVCMSLLTSYLTTAKSHTLAYSYDRLETLHLNQQQQKTIKKKLAQKLNANHQSINSNQSSIKVPKVVISEAKRHTLINTHYQDALQHIATQKKVTVDQIPASTKALIRQQITHTVNTTINQKESTIHAKIQHFTVDVHRQLKKNVAKAFLNVYQVIFPIALLSIAVIFIFKPKHQ